MNVGFIGLGKLGLPCALAIESKGHNVIGCDINPEINDIIKTRKLPYIEQGAQELLSKSNIKLVPLHMVIKHSDIIFVTVQTPHKPLFEGITKIPEERADFDYFHLKEAIKQVSEELDIIDEDRIINIVSTVLPTTIENQIKPLLSKHAKLCYNPFFIAMSTTIQDFLYSEFVLLGVDDKTAANKVKEFYKTITDAPIFETAIVNAELIKVSYNTFIGMKIAFANNLMEICHKIGGKANVDEITRCLSLATKRIISTNYMYGGMGDGGACHPRDNIALSFLAQKLDLSVDLFSLVMNAREKQTEWLAEIISKYNLPKVILGKTYKPETNLTVGSPSILLKNLLDEKNIECDIFDPYVDQVNGQVKRFSSKPHLFFIGTKHPYFKEFPFPSGSVVIDPFRYIPEKDGVTVIKIGQHKYADN